MLIKIFSKLKKEYSVYKTYFSTLMVIKEYANYHNITGHVIIELTLVLCIHASAHMLSNKMCKTIFIHQDLIWQREHSVFQTNSLDFFFRALL